MEIMADNSDRVRYSLGGIRSDILAIPWAYVRVLEGPNCFAPSNLTPEVYSHKQRATCSSQELYSVSTCNKGGK
jgi:hypothetical protein